MIKLGAKLLLFRKYYQIYHDISFPALKYTFIENRPEENKRAAGARRFCGGPSLGRGQGWGKKKAALPLFACFKWLIATFLFDEGTKKSGHV